MPLLKPDDMAFVALGSNLGDSARNVLRAFEKLEALSTKPLLRSSLWQTTPVDCPPGSPAFANSMAGLSPLPGETPESLLHKLQAIEREFGRKPKRMQNEARPLDLDIIYFLAEIRDTSELTLPHPRAHQRRFVLQPLSEIAPELILPGQTQTVKELLEGLPEDPSMRRLG